MNFTMSLSLVMVMMCTGYTAGNMNWYNRSDKLFLKSDLEEKETSLDTREVSYYKGDSLVGKAPTLICK